MIKVTRLQKPSRAAFQLLLLFSMIFLAVYAQASFAEGVFENRNKASHYLSGAELNRLQAEHRMRFGQAETKSSSFNSSNPWDKKKKKNQRPMQKASWGECRDFALTKRNYCYREGRNAYGCEQVYEARAKLCDSTL